jgi:N-acetylglucosamine-6-phosphate deacetylase
MKGRFQFLGSSGFGVYEIEGETATRVDGSADRLLVPGFVDIHIHGAFGVDFMSAQSPEDVSAWADRLVECGYEAFLPTTVTASPEDIRTALRNLPEHAAIAGFHLEGPFISRKYPGAQPQEWIVDPPLTDSVWDEILDDPRLRVITLAPELAGASELIKRLTSRGVIVSIGHTNATFEECETAERLGATHTTHTFNAMRPLHHREAGTVGYALSSDTLACELIYDRQHVSPEAAAILIRNKPADKLIAVSDATMAAGLPSGSAVHMWGLRGIVGDGDVRLEDGTLAGSAATLLDMFRNLHADFGPEVAIRACCFNPRRGLGLERPTTYIEFDGNLNQIGRHSRALG